MILYFGRLDYSYIYILAGLLLVKTKVLNRETLEPISKFVIKMAFPLMVFINITDGTDKKNLYESWPILVIAVGFYICIYAAGAMAVKFFKHLQESRVGIYRAMLLFGNIGFIGLPMISSVFPENGILYASVFMLIDQFMLWTLGVKLMSPKEKDGFKPEKTDQSCDGGNFTWNNTDAYGDADTGTSGYCFSKIGSTASPLAMIYVGGIFAGISLKNIYGKFHCMELYLVKMILSTNLFVFDSWNLSGFEEICVWRWR